MAALRAAMVNGEGGEEGLLFLLARPASSSLRCASIVGFEFCRPAPHFPHPYFNLLFVPFSSLLHIAPSLLLVVDFLQYLLLESGNHGTNGITVLDMLGLNPWAFGTLRSVFVCGGC